MPFDYHLSQDGGMLYTELTGRVTDHELLHYYRSILSRDLLEGRHELVDASGVTKMAITPVGQQRLAVLLEEHRQRLEGIRVALVAASDVVYGMFRMWQAQRQDGPAKVRVFRSRGAAQAWLKSTDRPAQTDLNAS